MNDVKIARISGACGIACVALTFGQFPLWLVGTAPSVYDGRGFAQHLFDIKCSVCQPRIGRAPHARSNKDRPRRTRPLLCREKRGAGGILNASGRRISCFPHSS